MALPYKWGSILGALQNVCSISYRRFSMLSDIQVFSDVNCSSTIVYGSCRHRHVQHADSFIFGSSVSGIGTVVS